MKFRIATIASLSALVVIAAGQAQAQNKKNWTTNTYTDSEVTSVENNYAGNSGNIKSTTTTTTTTTYEETINPGGRVMGEEVIDSTDSTVTTNTNSVKSNGNK